ncbi:MAG: NAD(P)-dependent oxidoreductase [Gammaproteobacteria bacterium]|nr:MAG: NAD(P)-dependent oxidoreductase [Gammaproteobacteria bacterium]
MSRVLVTGGAGFLGSHVADALAAAGHEVSLFDLEPSAWCAPGYREILGDIRDADTVAAAVAGHDAVIHLAALADLEAGLARPRDTLEINVCGTLNVLEGMRAHGIGRLLFASTVYVYSRHGGFYRCSKQAAESYIEEFARCSGIEYTILRYGSLYGPRADASNGVYRLIDKALRGEPIHHHGSPLDRREYIHVSDAARLSVQTLDAAYANRHIVITGHDALRIGDLFAMFAEMLGRPLDISYAYPDDAMVADTQRGHYGQTPYAYTPRPGHKLTAGEYVDMGQGLLQVFEEIDRELGNHGH